MSEREVDPFPRPLLQSIFYRFDVNRDQWIDAGELEQMIAFLIKVSVRTSSPLRSPGVVRQKISDFDEPEFALDIQALWAKQRTDSKRLENDAASQSKQ